MQNNGSLSSLAQGGRIKDFSQNVLGKSKNALKNLGSRPLGGDQNNCGFFPRMPCSTPI